MYVPEHLMFDFIALHPLLHGSTPIHHHLSDGRGWGKSRIYTVKEGYIITSSNKDINTDIKWNKVWCKDGLPKINVFLWILAHCKTLTINNLKKEGLKGLCVASSAKSQREYIPSFFGFPFYPRSLVSVSTRDAYKYDPSNKME